jgi:hypothetical protein
LPYLIGFSHSRGDNRQTFTEGLVEDHQKQYHHPDYLRHGHGFQPHYDFYSMGLVLLEIGRWKHVDQMLSRKKIHTLQERSEALVRECCDNLGNSMGVHYLEAVRFCLTGKFSKDRGGDEIRNEFEAQVVNRLSKCYA